MAVFSSKSHHVAAFLKAEDLEGKPHLYSLDESSLCFCLFVWVHKIDVISHPTIEKNLDFFSSSHSKLMETSSVISRADIDFFEGRGRKMQQRKNKLNGAEIQNKKKREMRSPGSRNKTPPTQIESIQIEALFTQTLASVI